MLGKNTHKHGELLDTFTEPPAPKLLTPVDIPIKCSTVLLLNYGSHKQKDLRICIQRVKNVLEVDAAVYPRERD